MSEDDDQENLARKWFKTLDDPDMVGQSEYRAIHDLLDDVCNDQYNDDPPDLDHVDTVLGEVQTWAKALRHALKIYRKDLKRKGKRKGA